MNKLLITIVLAMCFVAYASTDDPYSGDGDTSVDTSNKPSINPDDVEYHAHSHHHRHHRHRHRHHRHRHHSDGIDDPYSGYSGDGIDDPYSGDDIDDPYSGDDIDDPYSGDDIDDPYSGDRDTGVDTSNKPSINPDDVEYHDTKLSRFRKRHRHRHHHRHHRHRHGKFKCYKESSECKGKYELMKVRIAVAVTNYYLCRLKTFSNVV